MKRTSKLTDLLALTVFAVFALCVLLVLLTGAKVYRNLVNAGGESYTARTAAQYVTTRVRQAQNVGLEDFGGCEALTITEIIDSETYITRVYCFDGWLRELYCAENAVLSPADGEKVMELEELSFSLEEGILTAKVGSRKLSLYIRGEVDP